jgi:hypothetical protein
MDLLSEGLPTSSYHLKMVLSTIWIYCQRVFNILLPSENGIEYNMDLLSQAVNISGIVLCLPTFSCQLTDGGVQYGSIICQRELDNSKRQSSLELPH